MSAAARRKDVLSSVVVFAFLLVMVLGCAMPGMAQGPTSLGRTPWQMYRNPVVAPVPNFSPQHGDTRYYNYAPPIPATNDSQWSAAPNGSTIGFGNGSFSRLTQCWVQADFTFFQTLVDIPLGTTLSTFTIAFSGMDDGSRVTIFNSANPGGLVIPGSYVFLGDSGTTNLAPYVVAGETNRVVITQVDDCPVGNQLLVANVTLNGNVVLPTFKLTTNTIGAGQISVPAGVNCGVNCTSYTQGTVVTVLATPYLGYQFTGWSGACAGSGTCQVTMDADKTVTATFAQSTFSFDQIPTFPQPSQCSPLMMTWGRPKTSPPTSSNYDNVHVWYAKPTANQLSISLSVANFGKQSVEVIPIGNPIPSGPPLPGALVVDATGLSQGVTGFNFATGSATFSPLIPGTTYAIIVRLQALSKPVGANPNDPLDSGRHYRLEVQGSDALALDTLTRSILEHARVNWVVNHDGGSQLSLQFTKDTALPVYPNSNPLTGQITFVSPAAVITMVNIPPGDIASASGSQGIWRVVTDIHDHNNIEKLTGIDRHLYLDSLSCRGLLKVIKSVTNDNGGTKTASTFSITVTGNSVQPNATFNGSATGTTVSLLPGNYSVDEAADPAYSKTLSPDCVGFIAAGEEKTCVIANNDRPGQLTVIKNVINDNGGTKGPADFQITVTGVNVQPNATFNGSSAGTTVTLNAGSYSVGEAADTGYSMTPSADCSGSIANGQAKTCTITNDDKPGVLTVIKRVVNDSGGGFKSAADFSITVTGTNVQPSATFNGSSTGTTVTLNAGSYSVSEVSDWRYNMSLSADCSGSIANGQSKTCTITNDDKPSLDGRMTGGGSVFTPANDRVTHGMTLQCSVSALPQNLEINWGRGERFHLDTVTRMWCGNDPGIVPTPPTAAFDTLDGAGTGSYNGIPGATVTFVFTDAGEPGRNDTARITVRNQYGAIVLQVSGNLNNGNQQAH